jgi:uncharacterized protein (DUF1697 family)
MTPFLALLRGINVGGRNMIPMAELRSLAGGLGWTDVQSYVQSGNLIFSAAGPAGAREEELEAAVQQRFGRVIPVIVRSGAQWSEYVAGNPLRAEAERIPKQVILALSKATPRPGAVEGLSERAASGERIVQQGDAIWIHYGGGFAKSKLTPALLDRLAGSPVTTRNWRTVLKLGSMTLRG